MEILLISTYELGRQPFGLASPAAWLREEGCRVTCADLAVEKALDREAVRRADLLALYLPMHTATRLAADIIPQMRSLNPDAHVCCYGLYAPINESFLRTLGVQTVLGGEFEEGLVRLVGRLRQGGAQGTPPAVGDQSEPLVSLRRQEFKVPDRQGLPVLGRYAQLQMPDGEIRTVGYTEATRGCKHRCRHCPVVPVYDGNFRVVQRPVVLEDIRQQVALGARHITFGDPDFFNGPSHAVAIVRALHEEFPDVSYDATIKVQHLLKERHRLPILRDTGCVFVTCAVESVDDRVIEIFEKNHTRADFLEAVELLREVGLVMNPTFVTFNPWISIDGYLDFLRVILDCDLVDHVAPIQYGIRLLVTGNSRLLELREVQEIIGDFDHEKLAYPWSHTDPRVDQLHEEILSEVHQGQCHGEARREIFQRVWRAAHRLHEDSVERDLALAALDMAPPEATVPFLTEPWYC